MCLFVGVTFAGDNKSPLNISPDFSFNGTNTDGVKLARRRDMFREARNQRKNGQ